MRTTLRVADTEIAPPPHPAADVPDECCREACGRPNRRPEHDDDRQEDRGRQMKEIRERHD